MKNRSVTIILILLFSLCAPVFVQAQKVKVKRASVMKEVQGEITWVRPNKIAIVYWTDETGKTDSEILLPVENDIKLVHIRSMDQLSIGDLVRIQYEEVTEESIEGLRRNRKAKVITFVRQALKKSANNEAVVSEALSSGE